MPALPGKIKRRFGDLFARRIAGGSGTESACRTLGKESCSLAIPLVIREGLARDMPADRVSSAGLDGSCSPPMTAAMSGRLASVKPTDRVSIGLLIQALSISLRRSVRS